MHHRIKKHTHNAPKTHITKRVFKLVLLIAVILAIVFTLHLGASKVGSVALETTLYAVCDRVAENLFFS